MPIVKSKPKEIYFRELTEKVIAAEKEGFWSDWTEEQQKLFMSDDWEAFSRSRGYSEEEIAELREWIGLIKEGKAQGCNPLIAVKDLIFSAAEANIKKDKKGEIWKSSRPIF